MYVRICHLAGVTLHRITFNQYIKKLISLRSSAGFWITSGWMVFIIVFFAPNFNG